MGCCCCCFSFCSELHQPGRRAKTALDRSLFFLPYSLSSEHFHGEGGSGSRTSPARQQTTHRGTVGEWKSTGSANRQSNAKRDWGTGRGGGGRQQGRRRGKMWRGRGEGGGEGGWRWADASRAQLKMVFEVLRGSLPFIVSLNELFMFLCILHGVRWPPNASFLASWWICSFFIRLFTAACKFNYKHLVSEKD